MDIAFERNVQGTHGACGACTPGQTCCKSSVNVESWSSSVRTQGKKLKSNPGKFGRKLFLVFLAQTGAQVVTLSVCLSGASLFRAVNLHLSRSECTQKAIKAIEQTESSQITFRALQ